MASAIYRSFKEYKKERETNILVNNQPIKESIIAEQIEEKKAENNPEEKEATIIPPVENTATPKVTLPVYSVQIATSTKKLELLPQNFNGLIGVNVYEEYKLYKYTYGSFKSLEEAKTALTEAKQKGYGDAFLIAFYQDKKISIKEAQRLNP